MTTNQKILLGALLLCTVIFWIAALFLPNFRFKENNAKRDTNTANAGSEEIEDRYGNATHLTQSKQYIIQTLVAPYKPPKKVYSGLAYQVNAKSGYIKFSTPEWTFGNKTLYAEINNSVKGSIYSEDNIPLHYDIYVKDTIDPNIPVSSLFKSLKNYFAIPDSVNLDSPKEFDVSLQGKAMEVTWKNADGTLESRSVWNIKEEGVVYFIACRVFPDSPYYNNETCYYENTK